MCVWYSDLGVNMATKDHFSESITWEMGPLASSEHPGLMDVLWGVGGHRLLRDNLSGLLLLLVPKSLFPFSVWIPADC